MLSTEHNPASLWARHRADILVGTAFVLGVGVAFFLGRASAGLTALQTPIVVRIPGTETALDALTEGGGGLTQALTGPEATAEGVGEGGIPEAERHGVFVASRYGKYYYDPALPQAARLKPANRVWFANKQAAEAKGFAPYRP